MTDSARPPSGLRARPGAPSSGGGVTAAPEGGRAGVVDELRRVIRRIEARHVPRPAPEPVERVVGGEVLETEAGPLLVARRAYPLDHRHGRVTLGQAFAAPAEVLTAVVRRGDEGGDLRRLLFVDIETTGLAGGTGTYAFLVGVGALEEDRFVVTQYFLRDLDEEPALLAALRPRLEGTAGLVTFNGTGFDLPLLETRFVLGRQRWPEAPAHVDLLRPARRVWIGSLPDCRLGTIEAHALGLTRDDDVPGAMIPALYFQFLRTRQARPLARVFAHNRDDVLSLVALLAWFAGALSTGTARDLPPAELAGLGRLLEPLDLDRALDCYREALAQGLAGPAALWTCLRLAAWEKRRARWDEACALWQTALGHEIFDPRPWAELAKFQEHRRRDYANAREVVGRAISRARAARAPGRVVEEFAYRLARLERRLVPRCPEGVG